MESKMASLRNRLIRLGSENPNLQKHLRPILDAIRHADRQQGLFVGGETTFLSDIVQEGRLGSFVVHGSEESGPWTRLGLYFYEVSINGGKGFPGDGVQYPSIFGGDLMPNETYHEAVDAWEPAQSALDQARRGTKTKFDLDGGGKFSCRLRQSSNIEQALLGEQSLAMGGADKGAIVVFAVCSFRGQGSIELSSGDLDRIEVALQKIQRSGVGRAMASAAREIQGTLGAGLVDFKTHQ